jgi:hypothetical protein
MSKMSWRDTSALKKGASQSRDINFKDLFLRITPDKGEGNETTNTVRFLECPNAYLVHWPYKKGDDNKLAKTSFPDSDDVKKPNRVCHATINAKGKIEENANCPWCQMGYSKQLRYMVNVISRENGKVMILDAPPDVINAVYEWVETAMEEDADNCDPSSWEAPTPDFRIKSTRKHGGSIDWRCTPTTKQNKLQTADLELIRQANPTAETDEDALKLYDVNLFTKPSQFGGTAPVREVAKTVLAEVEEEEDELEAPVKPAVKASQGNAYSDSDPDDDDEDVQPVSTKKPSEAPAKAKKDSDEWEDWDNEN